MDLNNDISTLKGVGPKLTSYLNSLDIFTIKDMLLYFPRDYDFINSVSDAPNTEGHQCMVEGKIVKIDRDVRTKTGKIITTLYLDLGDRTLVCKWFNQPYIKNSFRIGESYKLQGKLNLFQGKQVLSNAKIVNNIAGDKSIIPKYSLNKSLTSTTLMKLVKQILAAVKIKDNLPENILKQYKLMDLDNAIRTIHFPEDKETLETSRRRLKFQELFVYSLKILMLKKYNRENNGGICYKIAEDMVNLRDSLPFNLTKSQSKVVREILLDQKSPYAMNRLLQGDVGSGKTIVAMIALFNVIRNGRQAALMAPTEILANQHYAEAVKVLGGFGINIALLTGSLSQKNKLILKENIKKGIVDLVIGTHAIIEDDVVFKSLGMIVTDEQHRFGVYQRARLLNKGENIDVLVMSATPIPRTLSLFIYGDLDISIMDELPPGRQKIETVLVEKMKKDRAYTKVLEEINKGRQAYIVCPMIEESEVLVLQSVTVLYEELKKSFFKNTEVAVLHGKMTPGEKDSIMTAFKQGKIKVLISTTVIEVGVNVPNASIMVIENAERFGLSQLHQLRGRVGRGEYKSFCILVADIKNDNTKKRMGIMVESNDGFKIAEEDMRLRGSGDMFGRNQSGDAGLMLADIYEDSELLRVANNEARNVLGNEMAYKDVIEELKESISKSSKYICFN